MRTGGDTPPPDWTFGILDLTLKPGSYDWEFVPATPGGFTDTGTGACH
jgi:hypothetical protein